MESDNLEDGLSRLKILSFDPASTKNIGWCVIYLEGDKDGGCSTFELAAGTFVMPSVADYWQALWPMFLAVDDFLNEEKPDVIIIEKTSAFAGGFITGQVSNCMGVILACCGKYDAKVDFVFPTHVKKVVTGKGRATKNVLKKSVRSILTHYGMKDVKFDSEHAYDAIANILCYLCDKGQLKNPLTEETNEP
jgi:crossover junction endodeoxyribonuclease RuvC